MTQGAKRWSVSGILRWVGSLVALALLVYLLSTQDWNDILGAVKQIPIWRLVLALAFMLCSRLSTVGRWQVLLQSASIKIPLRRTTSLTFTSLFSSNFLPTTVGGDVVRLIGLISLGYDRAISLASIAADRLISMAGMVLALPYGIVVFSQAGTTSFLPTFLGVAWVQRGWEFIKNTLAAFSTWLKKPYALLGAFCFALLNMLFLFLAIQQLAIGLGVSVTFWMVAGLYSISYFITLIPVSINGLGVQELSLTYLFSRVAGMDVHASLIMAVLIRLLFVATSLPGAVSLPFALAAIRAKDGQS